MDWELLPHRGISTGRIQIVVGSARADNRRAMAGLFPPPENRRDNEDQYLSDENTIFLRYDDDILNVIMFIKGRLSFDGLELHDTTWEHLAPELNARGFTINTEPKYFADGVDCPELGINIATWEDVGGDGDGIEWVSVWRGQR